MRLRRVTTASLSLVTASVMIIASPSAATGQVPAPVTAVDAADTANLLAAMLDSEQVDLDAPTEEGVIIPAAAESGLDVPAAGSDESVGIGLPSQAEGDVTDSGAVVYGDPGAETALLVHAVDVGGKPEVASETMTLITIGGPQAATEYPFPLQAPTGSTIELLDDGSVAVTDRDGHAAGVFPAPWAVDSDGNDVPTWFEVRDGGLVQHVMHQGYAYPVIADPVWMVPVVLVGARAAVQVAVRAGSASAARTAAAKAAASQAGKKVASTGTAAQMSYRSFTSSNARHNLIVRTGKSPKNCQAHHVIPQKFAAAVGGKVNIHDPNRMVWWVSTPGVAGNHASKAAAYNAEWDRWFRANPRATAAQIDGKMASMKNAFSQFYRC